MNAIRALLTLVLLAAPVHALAQEAAPPAPNTPPKNPNGMRKLFQIMKSEPTVKDVQAWAVAQYRLQPERIHELVRNARLKGLIPDLTVTASNMIGNSYTNSRDGLYPILPSPAENPNPNNFKERSATNNDELTWSVTAKWQLDRIVFSSEALDAKSLTSLQENLVREVTTLYFSRRRVLASIVLSPPTDDEEYFYELVRLDELSATLNAFTGYKFEKTAWDWQKELLGK